MLVGHVILAHKDPNQLRRLVLSLQHPEALIMIHLDRKTDIKGFKDLFNRPGIHFVRKRVSVSWGGFSQIKATLNSLEELLVIAPFVKYINLLSGQDYPVRKLSEFHEFLQNNSEGAFMEFLPLNDPWVQKSKDRFNRYHLADFSFFGKFKVERIMDALLPKRAFPKDFYLTGKSQWFTIDSECARYVLNFIKEHKHIYSSFTYSWGSDELFFQSILYNSPLKNRLQNNNLRYIDWSENKSSPKTLTLLDLSKIEDSNCFFARKFDEGIDKAILNHLDENVL